MLNAKELGDGSLDPASCDVLMRLNLCALLNYELTFSLKIKDI